MTTSRPGPYAGLIVLILGGTVLLAGFLFLLAIGAIKP